MMNVKHRSNQADGVSELDKIRDGLAYLTGEDDVPVRQIVTDKFIAENTDFETAANFFSAAGIKSENDLEKPEFNEFVKSHTRFEDWKEMLIQSSNRYAESRLGEQL